MSFGQGGSKSNPFRHSPTDKPRREVFPTDEIPHKWAHAAQSRARNPQGNLFFNGATIYSYRTNWPLARIYTRGKAGAKALERDNWAQHEPRDAGVLVLTNSERYSVTTAQHQSAVNQAASHLPRIAVPCVVVDDRYSMREAHEVNLKHFASVAAESFARAERAMTEWRFDGSIASARRAVEDTAKYMRFFGIRRKAPVFDSARYAKARERIQRILHPDEKTKARQTAQRVKRQSKLQAALRGAFGQWAQSVENYNARAREYLAARAAAASLTPEQVAQHWRETGEWPKGGSGREGAPTAPYAGYREERKFRQAGFTMPNVVGIPYDHTERPDDILLRVDGEQIITSLGARVPVAAATMVWALVQRARAGHDHAESAQLYGRRLRIGDYPLDRIDANGDLHAGCHHIKYAELELMARRLGLAS